MLKCDELDHWVQGKLNVLKVYSRPDRWVCDECYDHIFKDSG